MKLVVESSPSVPWTRPGAWAMVLLLVLPAIVPGQTPGPAPSELLLQPDHPAWSERAPELYRARFATSEGEFVLEVHRPWAPRGADRLYNLIRLGFFDDTRVYRVREGVFAQFGLSGDPAVNRVWYERTMPDDPRRRSNLRGMVSYAMLEQPDSRTTQLFVNLRDNLEFDDQGFAPLGRVVEGMAVVDAFHAGYGEEAGGGMRGGRQGRIVAEGNAHLDAEFPDLSRILRARIEPGRVLRFPDLGPNRIRAELHLLPPVSTGPMSPTWSPDGGRLAFSMRGDLWVMDAEGGEAIAVTRGPGYYFEPAWSPDGRVLAFSRELDGNLDVGMVRLDGGELRLLTGHEHVDVQPAWAADGRSVVFASARGGDLDLYRVSVSDLSRGSDASPEVEASREADAPGEADASRQVDVAPEADASPGVEAFQESGAGPELLVGGPGHQFHPAVSPDGSRLAFVSPVEDRPGTGGIWTLGLSGVADPATALERAELVHWEETAFRTWPAWSADGGSLVFVTDAAGSNDLAVLPAGGGAPLRLTWHEADELQPVVSPDGGRLAFVTNESGATTLVLAPAGGGRRENWRSVSPSRLRPAVPDGELVARVEDPETGEPVPARVHVVAADERSYVPEGGFHRVISATETHYFHTDGEARLRVPGGPVEVEAGRGPEYEAARARVEVAAGSTATVTLAPARLVDLPARGWISGDTHSHDLHQGRFGLTHESYFRQLVAEDLRVTNALIHMDGTRIMGRWEDLTGEPHPLSTASHVLQYAQEFRGSFGHVGLLGISEFVMPLVGGASGTAFAADALNADWLDAAHEQGGIGGYMHPYSRPVQEPEDAAFSEIALDVALGAGDFYDVVNYPYDDLVNAGMYWRFLNAGFRLPATGGSDNFADVWRDAPPGSSRTWARAEEGATDADAGAGAEGAVGEDAGAGADRPVDAGAWLRAVREGRTVASNGPFLDLRVAPVDPEDGTVLEGSAAGPGAEIALAGAAPATLELVVDAASVAPLDRVEILVNGVAEHVVDVRAEGRRFRLTRRVRVPGSAWVAAMAVGPAARAVTDAYPFAHTSPVYVVRDGAFYVDPDAARFLAEVVRAQWERVQDRDRFPDEASRERYRAAVERAIAAYEGIAAGRE